MFKNSFEVAEGVEWVAHVTGPWSSDCHSILTVMWIYFRCLAAILYLGRLQHLTVTWSPFATFPASFPHAESMGKLGGKITDHSAKFPSHLPAAYQPAPSFPLPPCTCTTLQRPRPSSHASCVGPPRTFPIRFWHSPISYLRLSPLFIDWPRHLMKSTRTAWYLSGIVMWLCFTTTSF